MVHGKGKDGYGGGGGYLQIKIFYFFVNKKTQGIWQEHRENTGILVLIGAWQPWRKKLRTYGNYSEFYLDRRMVTLSLVASAVFTIFTHVTLHCGHPAPKENVCNGIWSLQYSRFPLALENLEKWEKSGKSQGILKFYEKVGKFSVSQGKLDQKIIKLLCGTSLKIVVSRHSFVKD